MVLCIWRVIVHLSMNLIGNFRVNEKTIKSEKCEKVKMREIKESGVNGRKRK